MTPKPFWWGIALALGVLSLSPLAATRALAQDLGASRPHISLDVGKGRMIRLPGPAASVFVGDSKIADVQVKSPTTVYLIAKAPGETTFMAVDDHDTSLAEFDVDVELDSSQLSRDLKRLLPDSDIQVSTTRGGLVLSGAVASAADGETARTIASRYVPDPDHLINMMRVDAPNQVNLRVRVVEMSRDIIKAFGVNWLNTPQAGEFSFGVATGIGGITQSTPLLQGLNTLTGGFQKGLVDLNVVIDALDSEGLVTVLAEPNLTAVSGAAASFLAGGEYPIPVPQGLGQITIEYKKYGVSLGMVATITDGGRINLMVKPEVSQLSNTGAVTINGITVPALTTRRAETTVDLGSGQSFAIAGLMQNNINHTLQKFPGLGNMPVLGALFRSDRFERNETELVVIVTPYIVHPASKRLEVPTDGFVAATDAARILHGADYVQPPPAVSPPATSKGTQP